MKVFEIISENNVNEKPMGMLKRAGLGVMSKLGSKTAKAKLDVGKDANQTKKDLSVWMAGSGIKKGKLQPDQLKGFLRQKGLPTADVDRILGKSREAGGRDENEPLSNPEVDEILKKVTQQGFQRSGAGDPKQRSKFASPDATPQWATSRISPEDKAAIAMLKKKGYKISEPS